MKGADSLGYKYRTVEEILSRNKSDVIIVGRDIAQAPDPHPGSCGLPGDWLELLSKVLRFSRTF